MVADPRRCFGRPREHRIRPDLRHALSMGGVSATGKESGICLRPAGAYDRFSHLGLLSEVEPQVSFFEGAPAGGPDRFLALLKGREISLDAVRVAVFF